MQRLLGPGAVARYLGISRSQVYALGILNELPPVVVGMRRLYDIRDVDAWVDRRKAAQAKGRKQ